MKPSLLALVVAFGLLSSCTASLGALDQLANFLLIEPTAPTSVDMVHYQNTLEAGGADPVNDPLYILTLVHNESDLSEGQVSLAAVQAALATFE